ncbi:hypothetical protein FACS189446_8230 [Bacteroidia bacterium]|nr:hypothetical protein FACS189446_8230 [Bacteroidia bacterium]
MSFKKEIEQYLEQISVLEESYRKVRDLDALPVSFFSASLDIVNQLKTGLYELESSQLQMMSAHLNEHKEKGNDTGESIVKGIKEAKENVSVFLGDKISKKIHADLTKSLTVNQRFMFLRDLFKGNEGAMTQTLTHLNALQTLEEALDYLDNNHPVQWETESGIAFKELLEKRFT